MTTHIARESTTVRCEPYAGIPSTIDMKENLFSNFISTAMQLVEMISPVPPNHFWKELFFTSKPLH